MSSSSSPIPSRIVWHEVSRQLEIIFPQAKENKEAACFRLSSEFLRVHSPSAEVRGHGPGQEVLVLDKKEVTIDRIEPVGQYAIKLIFSDGHDTGIYSWEYLYQIGSHADELWQTYLNRVAKAQP